MKDVIWTAFADELEKVAGKADILPIAALLAGGYGVSKLAPSALRIPSAAVDTGVDKIRTRKLEGEFRPHGQEGSAGRGLSYTMLNRPDESGRRSFSPRQMGQYIRRQATEAAEEVRGEPLGIRSVFDTGRNPSGGPKRAGRWGLSREPGVSRTPQEAARRAIEYEDLANELGMPRSTTPLSFKTLLYGGYRAGDKPFPLAKAVKDLTRPAPEATEEYLNRLDNPEQISSRE